MGSAKIAVGIPSDLLRRRPDIQAAERQLAASTAGVGAATAQLFPQMMLGGVGGLASRNSGELFNGNSEILRRRPVRQLDGLRRRASQMKASNSAEAQVDAAKADYQDTVLRAFREVESSLVAVDRAQEQVKTCRGSRPVPAKPQRLRGAITSEVFLIN